MAALTPKQEAFVTAYLETGNASEAYRRAYDADGMKPETINRKAKEQLDNGKITARVQALRAAAAERAVVSVLSLTEELEQARALAIKEGQPSAAVSASMGKAKLHGLLTDKFDHKSSDGTMSPVLDASKLSTEALRELMAARDEADKG